MDTPGPEILKLVDEVKAAFAADDATRVRGILDRHPQLKALINEPVGPFDSPAIVNVCSNEMLDVLLDAGANVNARSRWWAGGFGLLDSAGPELAAYAIERGALVDVQAAARLGMMDRLRELIARDPSAVHARGGDGQTPLHFASTVEVAAYLLDHGGNIDARDVDHESTPAQYMVKERQDVARFLISRGCHTDLLMATAVGDRDLTRQHLDADPACIRMRVNDEFFPMVNPKAGGTIYQWTLGFHASAHQVARKFGHQHVLTLLLDRSPVDVKLIDACWTADEPTARGIRQEHPAIVAGLSEADRRQVAHAARNNQDAVVRLMLECGWPVDARGQHRATPLHWAAFHGNAEMAETILRFGPPLEATDADFNGTPLVWAIHGSGHGWYCRTGNYGATVESLIRAGAKRPGIIAGSTVVQDVLRRYASTSSSGSGDSVSAVHASVRSPRPASSTR
jgi:ankyrin repeat protein